MAEWQTSLEKGNEFRDTVAAILRTQYPDTSVEHRLGSKNVDIYFTRLEFGRRVRFGVECKNYAKPLTKDFIAEKIFTHYYPLINDKNLDRVIIVTPQEINAAARKYVESINWLNHQTDRQLQEELLGLRSYFELLENVFDEKELGSYYVGARLVNPSTTALSYVEAWLHAPGEQPPLAIMGGYGKGKTSFAERLISRQARRYLKDSTERMPILIRLGQVVHETQLEGLFGKEFTARQPNSGFRFETLSKLNSMGRLLIVLDGFDEMKHAMSASDYRSNFREFNRLLNANSRILMLGRPSAIPTEARNHVFRGFRTVVDSLSVRDPHFESWTEVEIDFFSATEITDFLRRYLNFLITTRRKKLPSDFLESRINEIQYEVDRDLLKRPVHAKIVAELASDPTFNLRGFNQHSLYSHFIRRLIQRDVEEKQARRSIGVSDRLKFQRNLAWWCWTKSGEGQSFFNRDEIPGYIVDSLPYGRAVDSESKLAEYLVSALTEEKEAGILYFAHRSFQEYLVVEYIRMLQPESKDHILIAGVLDEDIRQFLDAAPNQSHFESWYHTLDESVDCLPIEYYRYFQSNSQVVSWILEKQIWNFADVCILGLGGAVTDTAKLEEHVICALGATVRSGDELPAMMAVFCLLRWSRLGRSDALELLMTSLLTRIVSKAIVPSASAPQFFRRPKAGVVRRIFVDSIDLRKSAKGNHVFVNLRKMTDLAVKCLSDEWNRLDGKEALVWGYPSQTSIATLEDTASKKLNNANEQAFFKSETDRPREILDENEILKVVTAVPSRSLRKGIERFLNQYFLSLKIT